MGGDIHQRRVPRAGSGFGPHRLPERPRGSPARTRRAPTRGAPRCIKTISCGGARRTALGGPEHRTGPEDVRAPIAYRLPGSPGVALPAPVRMMLAQGVNAASVPWPGRLAPSAADTTELVHAERPVPGVPAVRARPDVGDQRDPHVGCANQAL